ncbi:MAG: hypothetical protein KF789_15080 [Bdellovibrionaceae bacterium]|nr:hypothetical protein [Pseudobdellovibrionaceae bacterium]
MNADPFNESFQTWIQESLDGKSPGLPLIHESRTPEEKGALFARCLFLFSAMAALIEEQSLVTRKGAESANSSPSPLELLLSRPEGRFLEFLRPFDGEFKPHFLKTLQGLFRALASELVQEVPPSVAMYPFFMKACVREMDFLCEGEGAVSRLLYRAFDRLDEALVLDYSGDRAMEANPQLRERLYEGAGEGVQTSYETILTLLRQLRLPPDAHLMDLGSGFGRVGLIAGLLRPDLSFSGYEYVSHRVLISETASRNCGVADRVRFYQQDLSQEDFQIPPADAYYMYDPFCRETYVQVLGRLNELARHRPMIVITKADAASWFAESLDQNRWLEPEPCDGGTIQIFRTRPEG